MSRKPRKHLSCPTCRCAAEFHGRTACLHCGVEFVKVAAEQRFCDSECRILYRTWLLRQKLEAHGRVWEDRDDTERR